MTKQLWITSKRRRAAVGPDDGGGQVRDQARRHGRHLRAEPRGGAPAPRNRQGANAFPSAAAPPRAERGPAAALVALLPSETAGRAGSGAALGVGSAPPIFFFLAPFFFFFL